MYVFNAINFPLFTALTVFHTFRYIVFSSHINSTHFSLPYFFISLETSFLTNVLFTSTTSCNWFDIHFSSNFASWEHLNIILKLPKKRSPCLNSFTGELNQMFKEELTPILHNLFQKLEEIRIIKLVFSDTETTQRQWDSSIRKERGLKSTKLEMKKDKLQRT